MKDKNTPNADWKGADLLACRVAKGITIKAMSEGTRLKQSVIHAIEREYHEVLPSHPLVTQRIRSQIAQYLGLKDHS